MVVSLAQDHQLNILPYFKLQRTRSSPLEFLLGEGRNRLCLTDFHLLVFVQISFVLFRISLQVLICSYTACNGEMLLITSWGVMLIARCCCHELIFPITAKVFGAPSGGAHIPQRSPRW